MGMPCASPSCTRASGPSPRSMARRRKSLSWRANPTIGNAGRRSAGQVPPPSSAWPWRSWRITASCSAPEISRSSSSSCCLTSANASECTERTTGSSEINPDAARASDSSARSLAPVSLESVSTSTPPAPRAPSASLRSLPRVRIASAAVSSRKLDTPEPGAPVTLYSPRCGSAVGHSRTVFSRERGTRYAFGSSATGGTGEDRREAMRQIVSLTPTRGSFAPAQLSNVCPIPHS